MSDPNPSPSPPRPPSVQVPEFELLDLVKIRQPLRAPIRIALGALGIGIVLLLWWFVTRGEERIIDAYTLPSLGETFASFPELWTDRALMRSAFASLSRVLGGFLLAAVIGVPLGILAGCFPAWNALLKPISIFGRNVPIAALIPLTLIWFGLGEQQKVMFIFFASVAFIFFDTCRSVSLVPGSFLDTACTVGARLNWSAGALQAFWYAMAYMLFFGLALFWMQDLNEPLSPGIFFSQRSTLWKLLLAGGLGFLLWLPIHAHQVIGKVLLPIALPDIINSLRLLFGLAFGYIILAEVIDAKFGLGKIIITSQRVGPREHIYLCLIVIACIAFLIDRLMLMIQRYCFPYKEDVSS